MPPPIKKPDIGLEALARALQCFSEEDCEMTVNRMLMLVEIAQQPGVRLSALQERLGISNGATSRNLQILGEWRKLGEPGQGLVVTVPDPAFVNRKICFLTPKGTKRMAKVLSRLLDREVTLESQSPAEFVKRAHAGETA